jgi:hypothetical protein
MRASTFCPAENPNNLEHFILADELCVNPRSKALGSLDLGAIRSNTPLRLAVAASIAYPDGSMTASGLRREAAKGRLVIERTAGKGYTTLDAIEKMRELCRVVSVPLGCGFVPQGNQAKERPSAPPSGSSSIGDDSH